MIMRCGKCGFDDVVGSICPRCSARPERAPDLPITASVLAELEGMLGDDDIRRVHTIDDDTDVMPAPGAPDARVDDPDDATATTTNAASSSDDSRRA